MILAVFGVITALQAGSFIGFFACFMALFFFTGVGNASTFQMIPVIMGKEVPRLMPQLTGADLASKLLAIRADMPIILCTGYSERWNKEVSVRIHKPPVASGNVFQTHSVSRPSARPMVSRTFETGRTW
mgnify:CR=1 FL=1